MTKPSKLGQNNNKAIVGGASNRHHGHDGTKAVESVSVSTMNKKAKEKEKDVTGIKHKEKEKAKEENKTQKNRRHTAGGQNVLGERSPSYSPHGTSSKTFDGLDGEGEVI